jgi:N-acetylmuramoyl-L-alanine amidase
MIVGGLALAGVAVAMAQGPAPAAGVQKVRFGGDRNETRIVIDLDRAATGKLLADGASDRRVVIGLPNVTTAGDLQGAGQGLVERWAIDEAAGGARLRLDLKANAEVRRRFLLPPGDGASAYRYVIDLKSTDAPGAVQRAGLKPTLVSAPVKASALRLKKVIVIDAGHGGKDPGSSGANTAEKDVTLAAAKALKAKLEKSGRYTVVMTRQSDTFVPLESRVQIARRADADLFISLHADSGPDATTRGASVYTLSEKGTERVARVLEKDDWLMKANLPGAIAPSARSCWTCRSAPPRTARPPSPKPAAVGGRGDDPAAPQPSRRRLHRAAGARRAGRAAGDGLHHQCRRRAAAEDLGGRGRLMDAVAGSIESYFAAQTWPARGSLGGESRWRLARCALEPWGKTRRTWPIPATAKPLTFLPIAL